MKLYHGTNLHAFENIKQHGLQDPHLTDIWEIAIIFAHHSTQKSPSKPTIITVELNQQDIPNLYADLRMKTNPIPEIKRHLPNEPLDHITKHNWLNSLEILHSIRYKGTLPPDQIKEISVGGQGNNPFRI